ncbi:AraC family transcriptional regulator [Nocardia sp. NPDC049220]|uniref:AraC family transcriptional regulator n=1 Tax=Nocardia sp. NPDC049220 TaxID=3155273 RepID=UPI0033FAAF10
MDDQEYQVEHLSTNAAQKKERTELWESHVDFNHNPLAYDFGDRDDQYDFEGETFVQRYDRDHLQIVEFTSKRITYHRTKRHVETDGDESFRFIFPLCGRLTLTQADQAVTLGPGRPALLRMNKPLGVAHDDGARALIVTVPPGGITFAQAESAPLALDKRRGTLAAVVALIETLALNRETTSALEFVQIYQRAIELLALSLDERWTPQQTRLAAVAQAAKTYVVAHSDDRDVTPDSIALYLNCSKRKVEVALQTVGELSPARLLTKHRLDRAQTRLLTEASTITEIAYASGFGSPTAFEKAFIDRHNVPPGKWRREALTQTSSRRDG